MQEMEIGKITASTNFLSHYFIAVFKQNCVHIFNSILNEICRCVFSAQSSLTDLKILRPLYTFYIQ